MIPADWIETGTWPTGTLKLDAPPAVIATRRVAINLTDALALNGLTAGVLAARAALTRREVDSILDGNDIPDFATVVLLEQTLRVTLWP